MNRSHRVALISCAALLSLRCEPDVELFRAASPPGPDGQAPRWTEAVSPTTSDLRSVWGTSASDVWAVGSGGVALRWDGASWRSFATGTAANLTSVWAARSDEAWAVGVNPDGSSVLLRWDGTQWVVSAPPSRSPRTSLRAVWGASATEPWLTGVSEMPDPSAWRWDSGLWRPEFIAGGMRPPGFVALGGTTEDLWLAGDIPVFVRHTAAGWEMPVPLPRGSNFDGGLCVSNDRSLWVSSGGNVFRYTAASWTSYPLAPLGVVRGLWCDTANDVWAVGEGAQAARWDGARWTLSIMPRPGLASVWRAPSGDAWAVGARGAIVRYGR